MDNKKGNALPSELSKNNKSKDSSKAVDTKGDKPLRKGPMSFLSGALTSLLLAWVSFLLSEKAVIYFTLHSPNYSSAIAQSIGSGFKTLVIGMSFLATFSFSFIGLGLVIVFIRSLFDARELEED